MAHRQRLTAAFEPVQKNVQWALFLERFILDIKENFCNLIEKI